jgi:hypothetical protein
MKIQDILCKFGFHDWVEVSHSYQFCYSYSRYECDNCAAKKSTSHNMGDCSDAIGMIGIIAVLVIVAFVVVGFWVVGNA